MVIGPKLTPRRSCQSAVRTLTTDCVSHRYYFVGAITHRSIAGVPELHVAQLPAVSLPVGKTALNLCSGDGNYGTQYETYLINSLGDAHVQYSSKKKRLEYRSGTDAVVRGPCARAYASAFSGEVCVRRKPHKTLRVEESPAMVIRWVRRRLSRIPVAGVDKRRATIVVTSSPSSRTAMPMPLVMKLIRAADARRRSPRCIGPLAARVWPVRSEVRSL